MMLNTSVLGGLDVSDLPAMTIVLEVEGESLSVVVEPDGPVEQRVRADLGGDAATADLHLACGPETALGVLTGQADLDGAVARGEASIRASATARAAFDQLVARAAGRFAP